MADRIDKLIPGAGYPITPTKDAKEDNRRQKGKQDESSFRRISDWERYFLMARQEQKSIQIPFRSVKEIRYRNATIHKGAIIFHVDLVLTDGSFQTGCLLQHPRLDLFSKTQAKQPGDLLPLEWFSDFDPLYVTLFPADQGAGPSPHVQRPEPNKIQFSVNLSQFWSASGIMDPNTGRYHFGLATLYGAIGLMILAAGWLLVKFLLVKV